MGLFRKSDIKKFYDVGETLGSGNFATVKKAVCKVKAHRDEFGIPEEVAVKVITKAKVEDLNDIEREIQIMKMIKHKNIIRLYEIHEEPKKTNLVMELVTGGELFDRIVDQYKDHGQYSEKDAAAVIKPICEALSYLHAKNVVHRDLKPENILLATKAPDAEIKIADFGLARLVSSKDLMRTACGTPGYVAPEVLKNQGYDSGAIDMWSVGVILYILLCGFPPFFEEDLPALFDMILNARYDFPSPWWDNVSGTAKDLVVKLLELDPKTRLTADQVLEHVWIAKPSDKPNEDAGKAFAKFNATRKLKKAAQKIAAAQRLARLARTNQAVRDGLTAESSN